ncbi:MAG: hypothetical protein KJO21_03965 [Verrucomicrobiae bacterium]|nr:hypothetical protein [Verrucomicrobiae bacterium]NNJ42655.1 hypothetical protein [Akkermansiaceae bacterium]
MFLKSRAVQTGSIRRSAILGVAAIISPGAVCPLVSVMGMVVPSSGIFLVLLGTLGQQKHPTHIYDYPIAVHLLSRAGPRQWLRHPCGSMTAALIHGNHEFIVRDGYSSPRKPKKEKYHDY